jgi:hypothetical protein
VNPTLQELIEMPPLRTEENLSMIFGCCRESSLMPNLTKLFPNEELKSERLAAEVLAELKLDFRRSWVVVRLRFDGKIIALAQMAGRELDDWVKLWVMEKAAYAEAIVHLNHLIIDSRADMLLAMAEKDMDINYGEPGSGNLFEFYGRKLTLGETAFDPSW